MIGTPLHRHLRILGFLLAASYSASAYEWPVQPFVGPHSINGTLGEYRDTGGAPHFHDGTDIGRPENTAVFPIAGGRIRIQNRGGINEEVIVGGFVYTHIRTDPNLNDNDPVVAFQTQLGVVNNQDHIHLIEGADLNALRAGGLSNYADAALPQVSDVRLFNAAVPAETAFINGDIISTRRIINIRARALDVQSLGRPNVGVHRIGYQVLDALTGALVLDRMPRQQYDDIAGNVTFAYDTAVSRGNPAQGFIFHYWASNTKDAATPFDANQLPRDGRYRLCVLAWDIQGNGGDVANQLGASCLPFRYDTTGPAPRVFDQNSILLANNAATNTSVFTVQADDGATGTGIKQIAFKHTGNGGVPGGPGCCSHIDVVRTFTMANRVETARFPDPAFGETFAFQDGEVFTATVRDFGDNDTSVSFTIRRPLLFDQFGLSIPAGTPTNTTGITTTATMSAAVSSITLSGPLATPIVKTFPGTAVTESASFPMVDSAAGTALPNGSYTVTAEALGGERSATTFRFNRTPPSVAVAGFASAPSGESLFPLSASFDASASAAPFSGGLQFFQELDDLNPITSYGFTPFQLDANSTYSLPKSIVLGGAPGRRYLAYDQSGNPGETIISLGTGNVEISGQHAGVGEFQGPTVSMGDGIVPLGQGGGGTLSQVKFGSNRVLLNYGALIDPYIDTSKRDAAVAAQTGDWAPATVSFEADISEQQYQVGDGVLTMKVNDSIIAVRSGAIPFSNFPTFPAVAIGDEPNSVFVGGSISYKLRIQLNSTVLVLGTARNETTGATRQITAPADQVLAVTSDVRGFVDSPQAVVFENSQDAKRAFDFDLPSPKAEQLLLGGVGVAMQSFTSPGTVTLTPALAKLPPGSTKPHIQPDIGYDLSNTAVGPLQMQIAIPYYQIDGDVPPEEFRMYRARPGDPFRPEIPTTYDAANQRLLGTDAEPGSRGFYFVTVPSFSLACAAHNEDGTCSFSVESTKADLLASEYQGPPIPAPPGTQQIGPLYKVPEATPPLGTAKVTQTLDKRLVLASQMAPDSLQINQTQAGDAGFGPALPLVAQGDATLSAEVEEFTSVFGVFGTPPSGAPGTDRTRPVTGLSASGPQVAASSSSLIVGRDASLRLDGVDPETPGEPTTGVFATVYLVDKTFSDPQTTPLSLSRGTFTVSEGTHSIRFLSEDRAGNFEPWTDAFVALDLTAPAVAFTTPAYYNSRHPNFTSLIADQLAGLSTGTLSVTLGGQPVPFTTSFETSGGTPPGPWQTSLHVLPSPIYAQGFALLNGRLYSIGGNDGATGSRAEVNFSALGTDGVPGAWTPTAPLPAARSELVAVTALGRLYALGGLGGGARGTNSIFYALPEPDGSIAGWLSASLPTPLGELAAVSFTASGLDLYAIGGVDAFGQTLKSVYVSRLTATGAPGPWERLADIPQPREQASAAQWNGRIYLVGGYDAFGALTSNKVYSAPLGDQSLGAWREERTLPVPLRTLGVVALQGRLYAIGGEDDARAVRSEVYSAAIDTDGHLAAWQTETPLPSRRAAFGTAASPSGIYLAGGHDGASHFKDTRYALGEPGSVFSARLDAIPTAPLQDGDHVLAASADDRVLNEGGGSVIIRVDATPPAITLSAGGVALSSAQTLYIASETPELTAQFSDEGSGLVPATALLLLDGATVQAGAPVSFTPASPLSPGRHTLLARVSDLAGNIGILSADFFVDPVAPVVRLSTPALGAIFGAAPIPLAASFADDLSGLATEQLSLLVGTVSFPAVIAQPVGGWQSGPSLPLAINNQGFALLNGRLYSVGGRDMAGGRAEVNFSALGADGVPGAWNTTSASLPDARYDLVAVAALDRLYALGGTGTGGGGLASANLFYAKPLANGTITAWTSAPLPAEMAGLSAVSFTSSGVDLFALGGYEDSGNPRKSVFVSRLDAATGAPGPWRQLADMPVKRAQAPAAQWNGRLYLLGGFEVTGAVDSNRVFSARLGVDALGNGLLDDWREERPMPPAVRLAGAAALQGRLYAIGGLDGANAVHAEVYSAAVGSDGRLAGWGSEPSLPSPLMAFGTAASDSNIYIAGGYNGSVNVTDTRYLFAAGRGAATASALASGLDQGPHEARATAADRAGNTAFSSTTFFVDLTAPHTDLVIAASSRTVGGTIFVLGAASVSFTATDGPEGFAAGLANTFLSVDAAPVALAAGQAFIGPGLSTLSYHSVDAVGNVEVAASSAVKFDAVAPGAAVGLSAAAVSAHELRLSWAAPGDDGAQGDIADAEARIEVRAQPLGFSTMAAQVALASGSLSAGQALSFTAGGLSPGTLYHAAVFTRDTAGNWSEPSAPSSATTFFLAESTNGVVALETPDPQATVVVVATEAATGAYAVAKASALEPVTEFYDLTADIPQNTAARLVFILPAGYDLKTLSIYTLTELGWSSASIVNQEVVLLADNTIEVSGEIAHTSLYTVMVRDTSPPLTAFSLAGPAVTLEGRVFAASPSSGVLTAEDQAPVGGARSGVAVTLFALDGAAEQPYTGPFPLAEGRRDVVFRSVDAEGNPETPKTAEVFVDGSAPALGAQLDQPMINIPGGFATLSATAVLTLSALEPEVNGARSGLAGAFYVLDGTTVTLAVTPGDAEAGDSRALGTGLHTLLWRAEDRVGNVGVRSLRIAVGDAQAPTLSFSFPRPDEPGLCRLAQGPVAVRGAATDEHMLGWDLSQGPVLLGSGTTDTGGLLGIWDAVGRSGAFTLTLSAADLLGNAASLELAVQAGAAARTLALGGKQVLNKPRGVATGPNRIYVSDTNADVVRVYDSAGAALAVFGDKRVKNGLRLNNPAGLAVDAAGNILAADANNKRVVKLSPAGIQLAEFGTGRLKRPVAVALTPSTVLVADAQTGEIVVFADSGALLSRVALPPVAGTDLDPEEPRPMALAADASGNLWVADSRGGRVLRYGPGLTLEQTIPGFARPEGVAVSPSGACLAVSDADTSRIRTFDAALGAQLAEFGEGQLHKPAQLAFNQAGDLLVADRNNDLVQGFGLPGTPFILAADPKKGGGFRTTGAEASAAVAQVVGRLEGGRVQHPDRTAVEVPAGALAEDTEVTISEGAERQGLGLAAAGAAREFGPHGIVFASPVTITLPYRPALLAGASPGELKVHYWNAERGFWEAVDSRVDEQTQTVSARVSHFSLYQVLAPVRAFAALADPEAAFKAGQIYVFPNPAVRSQAPTIHVEVGRADSVKIQFFDIAGTPVHETTLTGAPSVVDDGTGPRFAYEYSWQGHIPSGVYFYVVTAQKAGHAPIKRVGKFGVVR